jgi:hypothetical protein
MGLGRWPRRSKYAKSSRTDSPEPPPSHPAATTARGYSLAERAGPVLEQGPLIAWRAVAATGGRGGNRGWEDAPLRPAAVTARGYSLAARKAPNGGNKKADPKVSLGKNPARAGSYLSAISSL